MTAVATDSGRSSTGSNRVGDDGRRWAASGAEAFQADEERRREAGL